MGMRDELLMSAARRVIRKASTEPEASGEERRNAAS